LWDGVAFLEEDSIGVHEGRRSNLQRSTFEDREAGLDRDVSVGVVSDPTPKPGDTVITTSISADDFFDVIGFWSEIPHRISDIVYVARRRDHLVSDDDSEQASTGYVLHEKSPSYQ
jgi:hypothetical protein